MLRVKLKESVVTPDLETWKAGVSYLAKRIDDNKIEVYFPGSPVALYISADKVEIVKETKGGLA
jgi:hypothetical protein